MRAAGKDASLRSLVGIFLNTVLPVVRCFLDNSVFIKKKVTLHVIVSVHLLEGRKSDLQPCLPEFSAIYVISKGYYL